MHGLEHVGFSVKLALHDEYYCRDVAPDADNLLLLSGLQVGKDRFTMDYRHPMNAFQAFGICLSSFDNKLGCE